MGAPGNLATGFAAVAWLACAYWSVSYVRMADVLTRRIEDYQHRRGARRLEWIVLFGRSAGLPQDDNFRDLLGDARWAAWFALFFWTTAIVATGMLSSP
jgi:hypothetical protein